jgi:low temperature requirement protein LtrA
VLALIWWAWSAFVWAANAQDPDGPLFRTALLGAMVLIFITGLAVPHAFGDDATLFVCAYALVRFIHLGLYTYASRQGNASWSSIVGFAVATTIGMGLLIAGSSFEGTPRAVLWIVAILIDYAGPAWLTRERLRGLQEVAVAHFAERYGLFIIIVLGESLIAIGVGASGHPLTTELVATVALSVVLVVGLWWIYFGQFAARAEERLRAHGDPVLAAADSYSYLHLALVAGIVVFAVGIKHAILHVDEPLSDAARLCLCGGVALYLAGHAAFQARLIRRNDVAELVAGAAALGVFAVTGTAAAWIDLLALGCVLAVLVVREVTSPA